MNFKVQLTPIAQEDLAEIAKYRLKAEGKTRARKVVQTLNNAIHSLTSDPFRWPLTTPKGEPAQVRRFTVNPTYSILYSVDDYKITILRVWHNARNPEELE